MRAACKQILTMHVVLEELIVHSSNQECHATCPTRGSHMLPTLWTATTRRMQIHLDLVTLQTLPSSPLPIQVRAPDTPPAVPQILTLGFLHSWGWRFLNSYKRYFCIFTANRGLSGLVKDWTKALVFLQNWNPKDIIYLPTYLGVCVAGLKNCVLVWWDFAGYGNCTYPAR